jgi:hypothetical protein
VFIGVAPECSTRGFCPVPPRGCSGGADEGLVDVFDLGPGVGDHDAVRALLDGQRQLAQFLLGGAAFADVLHGADGEHRPSGLVEAQVGAFADPARRPSTTMRCSQS